MRAKMLFSTLLLGACVAGSGPLPMASAPAPMRLDASIAARNFADVVARVEPVAERECRSRSPRLNCDFMIVVDDRPGLGPNAFQTLDRSGRPVIGFTVALIADVRNQDELAFILGHEAGHHIAGHLPRTQQTAMAGALILGVLAAAGGADATGVRAAQDFGATVGARTYSRNFELEADRLGAIIAYRAGHDPERGAAFFTRIPDPGNRFLGTHPPNAQRVEVVRAEAARLRSGG
jgi:predicted Zn-dependent protease